MINTMKLSSPASRAVARRGKGTQVVKQYYVYMLASRRNGTLYTGVTNNVIFRTWQHKNDLVEGFTKKYGVHIQRCYRARKANQGLESGLENSAD
jgi:hypothetical protein